MHTHYETLKVARDAPPEVIRAAYKSLSQKHHPDRNPGDSSAVRVMAMINAAYEVLSDSVKRREYDEWIIEAESEPEVNTFPQPQAPWNPSLSWIPLPQPRSHFRRNWLAYALLIAGLPLALVFVRHEYSKAATPPSSRLPVVASTADDLAPMAKKKAILKEQRTVSPTQAREQIAELRRASGTVPAPEVAAPAPARVTPPAATSQSQSDSPPAPVVAASTPVPVAPRYATLPAGTTLIVRTRNTLSNVQNLKGDTFSATLERPLVADGYVIAAKGATVEGVVERSQRAGRVEGVSDLAITLVRVEASDGQRLSISTNLHEVRGGRSRGSDAKKIGAATAVGAIIGAIAGGGQGAAIGAGLGAGAGGGVVLSTRGKDAVIPSESHVVFYLKAALDVSER